ncbi:DUF6122 family protein [Aegicerativicinus sediminis]|uniref:DUF6122 family protein n=1 Tax=Aegicerativicinus sediminis TaxID=2893202 RepID=UPI001E29FFF3|nr:DUF6122 family protein [Aegicerativicinus sediminis]
MVDQLVHYGIHFLLPLIISIKFFKSIWVKAYLIMLLAFSIDLDHFLATPFFDPERCSINFHPLHTYWAIGIYIFLALLKPTRILGIGLVIHILADTLDCLL